MQGIGRIIAGICSILILIFAIIHLGVSIGILARFQPYGDIFHPERGIAGFNIVISLLGLIVGGVGIFAAASNRGNLSKIVAFASIVLAFFALVSLITSLIINSLAIGYSSSHFINQMNNYKDSEDSREIVDKIQTKYDCCGGNTWLDWSSVQLNATESTTNSTETTTTASGGGVETTTMAEGGNVTTAAARGGDSTTIATGGEGGTTLATGGGGGDGTTLATGGDGGTTLATGGGSGGGGEGGTTLATGGEGGTTLATGGGGGATVTTGGEGGTTLATGGGGGTTVATGGEGGTTANAGGANVTTEGSAIGKRAVNGDENINGFDINPNVSPLQRVIRQRRQTQSSYGGILGLPTSFAVTLPQSCCTTNLAATDDLTNLYCISNANNVSNNFHTDGCSPKIGKLAVGQTLGLAVINSFIIVLALAAIPLHFAIADDAAPPETGYNHELMTQAQPQYVAGGNDAAVYNQNIPNNTYDPAYQAYV